MGRGWQVRKSKPSAGDLYVLGAVTVWGVNFPISKFALSFMDPLVFSATRYLIAALVLFVILWFRHMPIAVTRREIAQYALIGLIGITIFQGGWAYGLSLTSASKTAVLLSTSPIFGALISAFLGNRPGWKGWVGIVLAFLGVALVINNSLTTLTIGAGSIVGDVMVIIAAIAWAVYTVISRPLIMKRGPIFVTAWAMLFGAAILTAFALPGILVQDWAHIPAIGWAAWLATAVFGAALGFVWFCAGILRLGVTKGMIYGFLTPVVAILSAMLMLDESISLAQIVGTVIILLGVLLARAD
ncbi:DMT family transporter [Sneathiella sp.]|uniref:DMT family transporter n=1 Tax=Sneathiella sp. TaxID=1964365 RepID=UPI002FE0E6A9